MNQYFIKNFLCVFFPLLLLEIFFKITCFSIFDWSTIRIFLFTIVTSLLISFIASFFKTVISKVIIGIFIFIGSLYTLVQMSFKAFMGNFMSFDMLMGGGNASRIGEEVTTFIHSIPLYYYLCFLPFIIIIIIFIVKRKSFVYEKPTTSYILKTLLAIIIIHVVSLGTLYLKFFDKNSLKPSDELYMSPTLTDVSLNQFGTLRFMNRDLFYILGGGEHDIIDIDPIQPEEPKDPDYSRTFDDTDWKSIMDTTKDSVVQNLHQYYMNQPITPKNEYTGMFEGKNLIMIMVESFDMVAINEELTPTLYKLKNEGWYFDHYYAPKFSCTTGDTEFISLTSIIPSNTVCTPFASVDNHYDTSIFNLFNKKEYKSTSYHNWNDQYYPRKQLHKNMGSSYFYNDDDLHIKNGYGWPSDLELMKKAYNLFDKESPYFSFMITVSMHFTYESDSKVVLDNWDKVKNLDVSKPMKRYYAKAIEFDKAMEYLLKTLEEDGTLDDTVIAFFGDHHPYNLDFDEISKLSSVDRNLDLQEDLMPFVIYNHGQEPKVISKTSSTYDVLPTLANLFNLDYDPRYYTGSDIFSDQESPVIFPSGSWVTDKAVYFANKGNYKLYDETINEDYITNMNKIVTNKLTASKNTLEKDYFKYRFPFLE